jgi:hypothetical protein
MLHAEYVKADGTGTTRCLTSVARAVTQRLETKHYRARRQG